MAETRIERLLEGKPDKTQNALRKAFMEAGIDEQDPIWVLIEVFNAYGEEIREHADRTEEKTAELKEIRQNIENDIKRSITAHFKMIRDVSFAEYAERLDKHAEKIEESLLTRADSTTKAITTKYNRIGNALLKTIDSRYKRIDGKIDKQLDDLVSNALRSRVHPVARMVSGIFGVSFLLIAMTLFAGVFMVAGAQAGAGNLDFLPELLNLKMATTGGQ